MRETTALLTIVVLLAAFTAVSAQTSDPCITTDKRINLAGDTLPPIEATLAGRLREDFYRFENLRPGERLVLRVTVTTNTSTGFNTLLMWEIRPSQFSRIGGVQTIQAGGPLEYVYSWAHSNFGENTSTTLCFKIGIFSEARPAKADYVITLGIERLVDTGGREAADKLEKATPLGALRTGETTIISGYLTNSSEGLDYVDTYVLTAVLGKGKQLTATLTTQPGNIYELVILDQTGYGLRSNRTNTSGEAAVSLETQDAAEKTYYIRVSNQGGVGGGGPYTITLSINEATTSTTTTTTTTPITTEITTPSLSHETAQLIVYGTVTGIAVLAVAATVIMRRRSQTVVGEEDQWY
ncbi:hypothetical protein CSUB_C0552 [Candidatus Caldarchaeum subterraneum]|uniref:Peptidase C-terminal archaeal/bacterial domain-containing protein n=1 Tax=Caldiarchaeum subterraneum TaxID=311458 RepID=E6N5P6_CALS0|nr:hypothetical protein HGMM_F15C06C19 [Candidatus Caldarchaeum subterraneum]BAJ50412.1 hypothetical protein CSUB_C0552 [Candidatus Caldarchaeum subterraneum]